METDRERRGENSPRPACLTYLEVDASARMRVSCAINRSTRARRPDYLARKSSAINTTSNTSIMVPLVFMKFYFILTTLAGLTAYGHSSVAEGKAFFTAAIAKKCLSLIIQRYSWSNQLEL